MITVLRAADRVAVPWKNGGGVTREVAAWPPGAGLDDFDWRVSIAEVRAAGPFSRFAEIDRTMAILEGRLMLAFADRVVVLTPETAPLSFRGDDSCSGEPIGGAVTDLNVMTRRNRCAARLECSTQGAIARDGEFVLIVARAATHVTGSGHEAMLGPRDACLIEQSGRASLSLAGNAYVIVIDTAR